MEGIGIDKITATTLYKKYQSHDGLFDYNSVYLIYKSNQIVHNKLKSLRQKIRSKVFGEFVYYQIKIRNKYILSDIKPVETTCHKFRRIIMHYPPLYHFDFSPEDNEDKGQYFNYLLSSFIKKYYFQNEQTFIHKNDTREAQRASNSHQNSFQSLRTYSRSRYNYHSVTKRRLLTVSQIC